MYLKISSKLYNAGKKIFDLLFSILAIILFSPAWIFIAIIVKLDSNGSIIFKQKRVGVNGKFFTIYKFRTLYSNSEKYATTPITANDQRITRIGKILRRKGLDEIPQFINIIKGEMSLIGPRPEMPFIVDLYQDNEKNRLKIVPGLTGLWQILANKKEPIHKNLKYDLYSDLNRTGRIYKNYKLSDN